MNQDLLSLCPEYLRKQDLLSLCPEYLRKPVVGWLKLNWAIATEMLLIKFPNWKYPPGPVVNLLPFVGSLPLFVYEHSYEMLSRMATKYGKIYALKMGSTNLVVISDTELLKETFGKEAVSGRSIPAVMDVMDRKGIIHADGPLMQSQRAFINRVIPNLTKHDHHMHNNFVDKANTAIRAFWGELEATEGKPTDVEAALGFAIINMFYASIVNTSFSREDGELALLISSTHDHYRKTNVISLANFIPVLSSLMILHDEKKAALDSKKKFTDYMQAIVERHRRELDRGQPKDLIDCFLVEMTSQNCSDNQYFTESQLYAVLGDIFGTSLETISATIQWLLLALLHHPEHQDKIYEEFNRVVGIPATGCLVDKRPELPYLEATIMEALRFSSILPIGVTHRAMEETTVRGYKVPKDSIVVGLFWQIHRNPTLWKNDPSKFNPTNHLDDNGKLVQSQNLLPFSTGQRSCLGDKVAFEVIALILANLVFKFRIEAEDVKQLPSLDDARFGILREPLPFKIKFIRR